MHEYPDRDLIGYGASPPNLEWPPDARLAVNFVLDYEEGAEHCVLRCISAPAREPSSASIENQ